MCDHCHVLFLRGLFRAALGLLLRSSAVQRYAERGLPSVPLPSGCRARTPVPQDAVTESRTCQRVGGGHTVCCHVCVFLGGWAQERGALPRAPLPSAQPLNFYCLFCAHYLLGSSPFHPACRPSTARTTPNPHTARRCIPLLQRPHISVRPGNYRSSSSWVAPSTNHQSPPATTRNPPNRGPPHATLGTGGAARRWV